MNVNDAVRELRRKEKEIKKAFSRTLPRRIGAKAVNLVNRNFREGGFMTEGCIPGREQGDRIPPRGRRAHTVPC